MSMKTVLKAALAAAAFAASLGVASAQEVKFGMAPEPYPPFASVDASGKWIGWEIELMDAVCAEAKLTCVIVPTAWDGIIPALTTKKIDVIWNSMSITD
jgi:polar amino acid transport system substrate-binding protein